MAKLRGIRKAGIEFVKKATAARYGFALKFFPDWHPELDDALRVLPGFAKIDLGTSNSGGVFDFEYKRNWAPEDGKKWYFDVCAKYIAFQTWLSKKLSGPRNGSKSVERGAE